MNLAGCHRIPLTTRADQIARALERAGWRVARLDGERCRSKEELLDEIGRVLGAPEWFGRNWDALVDLLRTEADADADADTGTGTGAAGLALVVDHGEHLGEASSTLADIVADLADEGSRLGLHLRSRPAWFRSVPHR